MKKEQVLDSNTRFVEFPKDREGNYRLPLTVIGQPLDSLGMLHAMSMSKQNPLWEEAPVFATRVQFERLGLNVREGASEVLASPYDDSLDDYYNISDTDLKEQYPDMYEKYVEASNRGNGEFLQDALFSMEEMINSHVEKNQFLFLTDNQKAAQQEAMKELQTKMECCYWGQDKLNYGISEVTFGLYVSKGLVTVDGEIEKAQSETQMVSQEQGKGQEKSDTLDIQIGQ